MNISWSETLWQRRLLFLALNGITALGLYVLVVLPIEHMLRARDAEIAGQMETLARWRAIARREPDIKSLITRNGAERGELLVVTNEGVANAELQARLKGLAEGAGARLRSMQGTPARSRGGVNYIGARLDLFGSLAAIHRVVYALEAHKPYLFVTGAVVKLGQPQAPPGAQAEPVIDAQLEVSAPLEFRGP